jgi:hypothetical protein
MLISLHIKRSALGTQRGVDSTTGPGGRSGTTDDTDGPGHLVFGRWVKSLPYHMTYVRFMELLVSVRLTDQLVMVPLFGVAGHGPPNGVAHHGLSDEVARHGPPDEVGRHDPYNGVARHGQPDGIARYCPPENVACQVRNISMLGFRSESAENNAKLILLFMAGLKH